MYGMTSIASNTIIAFSISLRNSDYASSSVIRVLKCPSMLNINAQESRPKAANWWRQARRTRTRENGI